MNKYLLLAVLLVGACSIAPTADRSPPAAPPAPTPASGVAPALEAWDVGLKNRAPVKLPAEVTFRLRLPIGGSVTAKAVTEDPAAKPLLKATLTLTAPNDATIRAESSGLTWAGSAMITSTKGLWPAEGAADAGTPYYWGDLRYRWRYPVVKNLWDENDRRDIGAANETLTPFAEKDFYLRLVLAGDTRQIWVDDRLVSEDRAANPAAARFELQTSAGAQVLSAGTDAPTEKDGFVPVPLGHYSHQHQAQNPADTSEPLKLTSADGHTVPVRAMLRAGADADLGQSLYRYRMTNGTGPDAPYVEGTYSYPNPFKIDPAELSFRVPYRPYQTAWLLAWVDDEKNAVPRGVFRFYQEDAGFPAASDFEITPGAIQKKLVTKLSNRTADGKSLYLIRVPIDTDAYYSFFDHEQRIVDFELSKPVALSRSYPDPIYYGYHPAGPRSSIHVVGITLEEAPFNYEVKPLKAAHVFERPEKPAYAVAVMNQSAAAFEAHVTLATKSFDGTETKTAEGKATVAPGASVDVPLSFDLKQNGWHELKVRVEAAGVVRENTLSLLVLPPNTRTYGTAANETRFGCWTFAAFYAPFRPKHFEQNAELLGVLRKLGMRRMARLDDYIKPEVFAQDGFIPPGAHTIGTIYEAYLKKGTDPAGWQKALDAELAANLKPNAGRPGHAYYYGGEWGPAPDMEYSPWPFYTGGGDREFTPKERKNVTEQVGVLSAIGREIRAKYPQTMLVLNWGTPMSTLAYIRCGFPKDLVDMYGMDVPMFETLPEMPNTNNSFQSLWQVRAETKRLGWPRLPIGWCEGPFLPTRPGSLTENEQADNLIRIWLGAMAFGVEQFECATNDFDPGNWYGAEHYCGGVFRRRPMDCPKPSAAAVATATAMLCGADVVGSVDTGCATTYCLALQRASTKEMIYALWRVRGTVVATLKIKGPSVVVTDAMGNARTLGAADGAVKVTVGSSPIWLTSAAAAEGFQCGEPHYDAAPAGITRSLAEMTPKKWAYDGAEDPAYTHAHSHVARIPDPNLSAQFDAGEEGHADAVAITLPPESGDRPLAARYGALVARKPITIPGKAAALGVWVKGNSSWGRVVYQLRDAKGQVWTSCGTKDQWNCDDAHGWAFISFEGWRYVRFPLPGNQPYDGARDLETTWWTSRGGGGTGGDGIVELPLKLEKIFVEARNEAPYLGEMKLIPERTYKLAGLVAEYASEEDAAGAAVARYNYRGTFPQWSGPSANPIARLRDEGIGEAPAIEEFKEPMQGADGRSMVIRFNSGAPGGPGNTPNGVKHNLYLARYEDGRGAELLVPDVKNEQTVSGLRPEMDLYMFLTTVSKDNKESKPSKAFRLVTHDKFLQK